MEKTKQEMLDCPFCGGKGDINYDEERDRYTPYCSNENCIGFDLDPNYVIEDEAILDWNTRDPGWFASFVHAKAKNDSMIEGINMAIETIEEIESSPYGCHILAIELLKECKDHICE